MVYNNHIINKKEIVPLQREEYLELKKLFDGEGKEILWKLMNNWRGKLEKPEDAFYIFSRAFYDEKLSDNKSIAILFNRIDSKYQDFVEEVRDKLNPMQIKSIILNFYDPVSYTHLTLPTNREV